jgi:N-formylglutamate amidohydrolase
MMILRAIAVLALSLFTIAPPGPPVGAPARAELVSPGDLVSAQRGSIPIIISAGHGGKVRVPGAPAQGRTGKDAVTVTDVNTAEIALLVGQRLTARLGGKPYVIIAQFSRKDADPNRAPELASECEPAAAQYRAFHGALRTAVDECRAAHPGAILIDLHGQVRAPGAIVRGTRNTKSVRRLIERAKLEALTGPTSIPGKLKELGYTILPEAGDAEAPAGRETFFDGGYITEHYGSHNADGIDTIQLELGGETSKNLAKLADDLAEAIATFARAHQKPVEAIKPAR